MKKFFKILISLLALSSFLIALIIGVVLFKPDIFLNKDNLRLALDKSGVFENYSWKSASIETEYIDFNTRRLKGKFKDFCFEYNKDQTVAKGCLDILSWDITANFTFMGIKLERPSPIVIKSDLIEVSLPSSGPVKQAQDEESGPPDIYGLWKILWADYIPDLYLDIKTVKIKKGPSENSFDIKINKLKKRLRLVSLGIVLKADPQGFLLEPPRKMKLPVEAPFLGPLVIYNSEARGNIGEDKFSVEIKAESLGANLKARTHIELPLKAPPGDWRFLKELALNAKAQVRIENFKENFERHVQEPYNTLPAPLNSLDGKAILELGFNEGLKSEEVEGAARLLVDMEGASQELEFEIDGKGVIDLKALRPGAIFIGGKLYKVVLQVPRLPKTSLPPQFFPDGRIHRQESEFNQSLAHKEETKSKMDLDMRIQALKEKSLSFDTNLLTSPLKLNMDLQIEASELVGGFVKVLPFKTEFFNRDVELEKFYISFDEPKAPKMEGQVLFDLPEYKVTLNLEGPLSSPRHTLSSDPPLPEEDIYAVLLFGRPMIDLEGGDKDAAQRTNQVLSQGILSIGVLYYLSDTPVQAIIYDPDSEKVQAQFGISEKASLTVGADSVGVRQSIGNGWYVDTSKNTDEGYGLMLERIIAY